MKFKEALQGMSKSEFARIAGIAPRTVYRWEEAPPWALTILRQHRELVRLRERVHVLDRLSQTLIDSPPKEMRYEV